MKPNPPSPLRPLGRDDSSYEPKPKMRRSGGGEGKEEEGEEEENLAQRQPDLVVERIPTPPEPVRRVSSTGAKSEGGRDQESDDREMEEPLIRSISDFKKKEHKSCHKSCTNIRPDIGLSDEELMVTTTRELNEILRGLRISASRAKKIRAERRLLRCRHYSEGLRRRFVEDRTRLKAEINGLDENIRKDWHEALKRREMLKDLEEQEANLDKEIIQEFPDLIAEKMESEEDFEVLCACNKDEPKAKASKCKLCSWMCKCDDEKRQCNFCRKGMLKESMMAYDFEHRSNETKKENNQGLSNGHQELIC